MTTNTTDDDERYLTALPPIMEGWDSPEDDERPIAICDFAQAR
jgi:hypothetical protein